MLEGLLPFSGYARFFATLTAVLDPFLAVPIFLAVTAHRGPEQRRRLVNAVTVTVFAVLAGPGAISTTILAAQAGGAAHFAAILGCILLVCALANQTMAEGLRQLFPGLA